MSTQAKRARILLADDDMAFTWTVSDKLRRSGFTVEVARDRYETLEKVKTFRPDVLLLDIHMPEPGDGVQVLRQMRAAKDWTPVIMLTIVKGEDERTQLINEGADDYMEKPYSHLELVSRIKAQLRRGERLPTDRYVYGPLEINTTAGQAFLDGKPLNLTNRAFLVLKLLMLHHGETLEHDFILREVWLWDDAGLAALSERIHELRDALGDDPQFPRFIKTIHGVGYSFIGEVEPAP